MPSIYLYISGLCFVSKGYIATFNSDCGSSGTHKAPTLTCCRWLKLPICVVRLSPRKHRLYHAPKRSAKDPGFSTLARVKVSQDRRIALRSILQPGQISYKEHPHLVNGHPTLWPPPVPQTHKLSIRTTPPSFVVNSFSYTIPTSENAGITTNKLSTLPSRECF
ncbi:hypothetical protein NEOLEDRAFT_1143321 [Neolentinus lepideus HHB14362 ss-1]|uniref:Uncharacterized protein n=1 Tax=Neolentinus lepideus HHB14362 ss-1 TaxID=1314782 RepID=A0A165MLN2_9AGAM|nr:hypothetical protein NEOLEDRAFT_1143321 [Neolentinus lepideus HHB14362 ss-1]